MLATARMRPRLDRTAPARPNAVIDRIRERLEAPDAPCVGAIYGHHAVLKIPEERRHTWSPQLSLDVVRHAAGSRIQGVFGPRAAVWTLFMALYSAVGFLGVMGLVFGYSQWTLGVSATALWSGPGALALGLGIYATALFGQRLGYDQMVELKTFLDEAIDDTPAP